MASPKIIHTSGKRKRAVARATIRQGTGKILINNTPLDLMAPKSARLRLREPLLIAGDTSNSVNISIIVCGGGIIAQAEASRLAIAKALVEFTKDKKLKEDFLEYDRHLLVGDVRRKEVCKPNDSKARAKRQKSYR